MRLLAGYTQAEARPGYVGDQFWGISIALNGSFDDIVVQEDPTEIKSIHLLSMEDVVKLSPEQQKAEFLGDAVVMMQRLLKGEGFALKNKDKTWKF